MLIALGFIQCKFFHLFSIAEDLKMDPKVSVFSSPVVANNSMAERNLVLPRIWSDGVLNPVFLSFFQKRQEGKGLVYVPLTHVPNVLM
jgi:hypothetical protein